MPSENSDRPFTSSGDEIKRADTPTSVDSRDVQAQLPIDGEGERRSTTLCFWLFPCFYVSIFASLFAFLLSRPQAELIATYCTVPALR